MTNVETTEFQLFMIFLNSFSYIYYVCPEIFARATFQKLDKTDMYLESLCRLGVNNKE
jgi:hypothetical protein